MKSQGITIESTESSSIDTNSFPEEYLSIDIDIDPTQPHTHNGKRIDRIIISQEVNSAFDIYSKEVHGMIYAVTYSEADNSILGWLVNIEENGRQQSDVYFKLDQFYDIESFVLYKKILSFCYYEYHDDDACYKYNCRLIDLSDNGRFLQLNVKHPEISYDNSMGFLPNGDLVLVSLGYKDCKIYKYSFIDKPKTGATSWKYSQMYDIEIPKSSKRLFCCFVYEIKLFLFDKHRFTQWNLLTMTFEMQYLLEDDDIYSTNIVINKNQTLLALSIGDTKGFVVFSMETGRRILRYDHDYNPVEFVTLKDGSEGLIVSKYENGHYEYKFLDPFLPSDDVMNITNVVKNPKDIITKSNRKISIIDNNVCVADGLSENTFQQMLNKTTYHNNIYTLSTFKTIQNMLKNIIKRNNKICYDSIELSNGKLFHFNLYIKYSSGLNTGIRNNKTSRTWYFDYDTFSYEQLNNQDLALITSKGIVIYTLVKENLRLRYFWSNKKWNDYYKEPGTKRNITDFINLIQEILDNEFNNLLSSLPSPNFITILENFGDKDELYENLISNIIDDPVEFSKFGLKILEAAIDKKDDSIVQLIFDKIIKLFESIENNLADKALLPFISLNLPKLCNHYYSNLVIKYILHTSIILDPFCSSVKHSKNTSLYAYSRNIVSIPSNNNYFKSLSSFYKNYLKIRQETQKTPVISFVVPFPQICKYQDNDCNNLWNEMLYKPKSILFCNIDSKNFYGWWNFAAIIDFKWKTFGRIYYYLAWSFYTIFFLCFALASTLDEITNFYRNILFIISILLGFIHLFFEIRQCIWRPNTYFNDAWNLFDVGAYFLPVITSIYWLINGKPSLWITAMSNLLLNFRFLLFFRIHHSFGIYFAIMIGVAKKVFPFLVVLFFIIFGFAHAFFITLKPTKNFSLDDPTFDKNDENNPWNLATEFNSINSDGTISSNPTLIQHPDSNTNMFNRFLTSLLAMYLLLIGDTGSLSSWTYNESSLMTILLVLFTFSTVIYLMNLFVGLLNLAIGDYNKNEEFLLQKALIIMEIELFYMLPYQKNKKEWFPDWIYYDIPINEVRKLINAIDNNQTELNLPPFISKKLRKLAEIPDPVDKLKQQAEDIENKFKQLTNNMEDKLSEIEQRMMRNMQELLKDFKDFNNIISHKTKNGNFCC